MLRFFLKKICIKVGATKCSLWSLYTAAVSALRSEPTLSGGLLKGPACSQPAAASLTQGSPFPWKMCLNKNEEKFSSLPFSFLTLGGTNEDWYVFPLVFQFKYAVMHLMRKGSLHPSCFLYGTLPSPRHFAIAGVTSAEIWGQGGAAAGAPLALWGVCESWLPPGTPLLIFYSFSPLFLWDLLWLFWGDFPVILWRGNFFSFLAN